jgi:hypothetical protein
MTTSTPWHAFDADDVCVGPEAAIVVQGSRRVLVRNVTPAQARQLARACRAGAFRHGELDERLVDELARSSLVSAPLREAPAARRRAGPRVPSRIVARLAAPLRPLTTWQAQLAIVALVVGLLAAGAVELSRGVSPLRWVTALRPVDVLVAALVFFLTAVVHELGHAAACLRHTGMTGGIRLASYRGLPALAADVSAICLTGKAGRANVAISGGVMQAAVAALLLPVGNEAVRLGATMALLSALFVVTPLPLTDGYWCLRDLFDLDLRPRLRGLSGGRAGLVYGWSLCAMTLFFGAMLSIECVAMFRALGPVLATSPARACLLGAANLYLAVVTLLFVHRNYALLRQQ